MHLNIHSKAKSDARHWRPTRGINQRADCSNHTDAKMSAMNTALLFSSAFAAAAYTVVLCVPTYYYYFPKKCIPRSLLTSNVYALWYNVKNVTVFWFLELLEFAWSPSHRNSGYNWPVADGEKENFLSTVLLLKQYIKILSYCVTASVYNVPRIFYYYTCIYCMICLR